MKRSFRIEKKFFTMEKVKEWITIQEKSGGFLSIVDLSVDAAKWLAWKLGVFLSKEQNLGFLGSKSFKELDVVLTVKANTAGTFLSILCLHKTGAKGRTSIFCPLRGDGDGGSLFLRHLRDCLCDRLTSDSMFRITEKKYFAQAPAKQMKEIQDLNLNPGFHKRSDFLRKYAVIIKSDNPKLDWKYVNEDLHEALELKGTFKLLAFSTDSALLEFCSEEDRNVCLDAKEVYIRDATLTCRRWSPGVGTSCSDLLKLRDRWIMLKGIPFHLWHSDIYKLICADFGNFKKVEVLNTQSCDEISLRVFVQNCDLKKMPAVISLLDFGLAFPIKLSLMEDEEVERTDGGSDSDGIDEACDGEDQEWHKVKKKRLFSTSKSPHSGNSSSHADPHSIRNSNPKRLKSAIGDSFLSTHLAASDTEPENCKTKGSLMDTLHGVPGSSRVSSLNSFSPLTNAEHDPVSPSKVSHVSDSFASLTKPSWVSIVRNTFSESSVSHYAGSVASGINTLEDVEWAPARKDDENLIVVEGASVTDSDGEDRESEELHMEDTTAKHGPPQPLGKQMITSEKIDAEKMEADRDDLFTAGWAVISDTDDSELSVDEVLDEVLETDEEDGGLVSSQAEVDDDSSGSGEWIADKVLPAGKFYGFGKAAEEPNVEELLVTIDRKAEEEARKCTRQKKGKPAKKFDGSSPVSDEF